MTLGTKLVSSFLACGLIPLGVVAYMSYSTASTGMDTINAKGEEGLEQNAYNQLVALRDVKKAQIETYFGERQGDMGVLMETVGTLREESLNKLVALREVKKKQVETYFGERQGDMGVLLETVDTLRTEAFNKLVAVREIKKKQIEEYLEKALLDMEVFARSEDVASLYAKLKQYHIDTDTQPDGPYDVTTPEYKQLWEEHGQKILQYYKDTGVYDVFMVCAAHGHVMYSCAKESDMGANLGHGTLKDSHLAKLWSKIKEKDGRAVVDFEPYSPSNGDPACFAGAPIRDEDGQMQGMMVVQFPLDKINSIMQMRAGLGETGETYLVGPDQLMRSDSFLDPEHHSVAASFKDPSTGSVNTAASKAACAGETGAKVVMDYNNNPVLSAYTSITFEDLSWGLLAEIDVEEAFCPKDSNGEYFFKKYADMYGYYDLFLINPDGYCFYTVAQEADYHTNFVNGEYSSSNLGRLTREVLQSKKFGFADFAPYAPSNGTPAAFVAQPVIKDGKAELIVALQLPLDAINNIMGVRNGMGETGETYLIGPDKLMRSDSFLDPENHTVATSFANPAKGSVDTDAATAALAGRTDATVILDYNGNPVLSAYTPVDVFGTTWGLIAEIDVSEAFCPKDANGEYFFKKYSDMYGYYDLFLINPDGYCFFTVCQEADYQTNLVNGKYADSGLGVVVREVLDSGTFGFADFKPYAPSNGTPASFIAQPVMQDGKAELVVALQLPLDAINGIMGIRSGMGETGETYLIGPDKLMRSDSFLDPANHTVAASFANPSKGSVDTDAATAALKGETDAKIITDYNGSQVLSAYAPIDVFGIQWALLAEIDESEALAAVVDMQQTSNSATSGLVTWVGSLGGIAALLVAFVSVFVARSISKPINRIIAGLNEGADQVNDAASQVSSASQQSAEGASEQASSLEETSSALEEMAAMTRTNAENSKQANELSGQARDAAQGGDKTMEKLNSAMTAINESSGQISKIIKVIEEIAFQTNLLALNAAVEAARAGEHGKGFAVVADEVRNLAQRAAQAARETTSLIEDSVNKAKEGTDVASEVGKALGTIVGDVGKVTDLIDGISKASEEQAQGVDQVNTAVSQMDKVTQQNAAGAEESASAAEELSAQAQTVKGMVNELGALVNGNQDGSGGGSSPAPPTAKAPKAKTSKKAALPVSGGSEEDFMSFDGDGGEDIKDF